LSPVDLGIDVETFGIETATSSLNRVVVDLRLGAVLLIIGISREARLSSSSRTTASSSPAAAPDFVFWSWVELEDSLDPELDFLSIGGGRVAALLFSFSTKLFFATALAGLAVVGVAELSSGSSSLDRGSASVELAGGVEGALDEGDPERAAS